MSKCNKCKYEYHPMIATPCVFCREQYGEGSLGYITFGDKFQPKERAEIKADTENKADMVNHGCETCLYEYLSECEEPCAHCTFNIEPSSVRYNKAKNCYVPKNISSNCTTSCKEGNKNFSNEDYGFKEISKDEVDMVNHPQHYNRDGAMECMDEMITVFGKDIVACFCLCNTWKYRYRASNKGHEEDLAKSDYYMDKYKELITQRSVLGSESTITLEELKDIVKEKLEKSYTGREIKKNDN